MLRGENGGKSLPVFFSYLLNVPLESDHSIVKDALYNVLIGYLFRLKYLLFIKFLPYETCEIAYIF